MKKFTLLQVSFVLSSIFYLLFSTSAPGQNYQNICTPGTTYFKSESNYFKAFRLDSIHLPGNGDTIFYSYRTIYPGYFFPACFDTTNGSILGLTVYKKSNGTFHFFNQYHDTITLQPQATLNQTWKFCKLTGTDKIEAKVTSIETDSVLTILDQVKVITLQAKNSSGGNINHYLNGRTIKISQHLGIAKILNLYYVPENETNDTSNYYLAGMTSTGVGYQNLTWKQVFDFEVGDEFHFQGQYQGGPYWKSMKRVLTKMVAANGDSVSYTFQYCKAMWVPQPPSGVIYTFDTITESYPDPYSGNNLAIASLPYEFLPDGDPWQPTAASYNRLINFTGEYTQQFNDWNYIYNASTHCWEYPFEGGMHQLDFSEGLGVTRIDHQEVGIGIIWWWENLVYYQKGSVTWGTPVATSCNTLVDTEEPGVEDNFEVLIVPNPVESFAEITVKGYHGNGRLRIALLNQLGQVVASGEMDKNTYHFERSGLRSGLYFLKIYDSEHSFTGITKIILK